MAKVKFIFLCVCLLLLAACDYYSVPLPDVSGGETSALEVPVTPDVPVEADTDTARKTVTVAGKDYVLAAETLYDGAVSVMLPEALSPASDELAEDKYFTQYLPDYMFANEDGSIAFTFDAIGYKMRSDEVFYSTFAFRNAIQRLSPKNNYISLDSIRLGGTELGYFDYTVPTGNDNGYAANEEAYAMFYITPMAGQILFGTFTCPKDAYEEWKPVILDIMEEISTKDSQAERERGPLTDFWPETGDEDGNYEFRLLGGDISVTLPVDEKQPRDIFPDCDVPFSLGARINARSPFRMTAPVDDDEDDEDEEEEDKSGYRQATESVLEQSPAIFLPRAVTVRKGDNLWNIARREYGSGTLYTRIYEHNREIIGGNPSRIDIGQILELPPLVDTEISIAGETYVFERRELFDGKMSMVMPVGFTEMPEYYARRKYWHYSDSDDGYTMLRMSNEAVNITFLFSLDDEPYTSEEVYENILRIREDWDVYKPSFTPSEPDIITLEDGEKLGYADYITPSFDGDIFNIIYVTPIDGVGLMGWFSCNTERAGEWKAYAHEALRTIRYEGKNNPVSQNAGEYFDRALEYYDAGMNTAALTEMDKAIRLAPGKAVYYQNRGVIYMALGARDEALADLDKAIELDGSEYLAYYNRGLIKKEFKDYHAAIEDFDKSIELNPDYALSRHNRAASYWGLRENEPAIADWNIALELEPDNAIYIQSRGVSYENSGQHEKAIADYNRAIELDPENADYWYARGNYYCNSGIFSKAILDYNRAIELNPAVNYACQHNRAYSYFHLGDYDEAIKDFTEALKYSDKDANTYNLRGYAYYYTRQYDKAINDFTTAICIGANYPNYADFYYSRGLAYSETDNYGKFDLDMKKYDELKWG